MYMKQVQKGYCLLIIYMVFKSITSYWLFQQGVALSLHVSCFSDSIVDMMKKF